MRIILLAGEKGTGKTSTLKQLYDKLTNGEKENIREAKKEILYGNNDFECIVSHSGKWVAIYSMGDYCEKVITAIIKYAHLDVIVLACSTCFKEEIETEVRQNGFHLCIIEKTVPDDKDCAEIIVRIIAKIEEP